MDKKLKTVAFGRLFVFIIITVLAILTIFPLLWILSTSFKSESEIITGGFHLLPKKFSLETYNSILFDNTFASQVPILYITVNNDDSTKYNYCPLI